MSTPSTKVRPTARRMLFGSRTLLKRRSGVLVAEHYGEHDSQDTPGRLRRMHTIRQGDSCLSFYDYR